MNKTATLLIVDDDNRNIFALKMVLKAKGFRCETATSYPEALDILEQKPIRLVLMDMMMPEIDGYQAIKELKANPSYQGLPIIAITAQAMTGDREKCLAAGASSYVSKPVNIDCLMLAINQHLSDD